MTGNVSETAQNPIKESVSGDGEICPFYFPYIVRQILISRSQPQPAMKNAAAGGKMIATYGRNLVRFRAVIGRELITTHDNEADV
jgi:hypothetical protein